MQNAFYGIDSVRIELESWHRVGGLSRSTSLTTTIRDFDDFKVVGRYSVSSLRPGFPYSSSDWIQHYRIRGIPFTWSPKQKRWESEALSISDKEVQEDLMYSTFNSLFYITQHQALEETLTYRGKEERSGIDCYLISYQLDPEMFSQYLLMADLEVKIWLDQKTFLPVSQRAEGQIGPFDVLERITYYDYNQISDFLVPDSIIQEVEVQKRELKEKIPEIKREVASIRGWNPDSLSDLDIRFIQRSELREIIREKVEKEYSDELIEKEGLIFKLLNLIPDEIDYREVVINNSDAVLIAGLYDPEEKIVYVGDYLEPALAELVLAHELVHAFQDYEFDLSQLMDSVKKDHDRRFALQSLIEGEAIAVQLEYLLKKDKESFKDLEDIRDLIEASIIQDASLSGSNLFYNVYGYGAIFIQNWIKERGWPRIRDLYQGPLLSSKDIIFPWLYGFRQRALQVNPKLLTQSSVGDIFLGNEWEAIYSTRLGAKLILMSLSSLLDFDLSERIAAAWEDDSLTIYRNQEDSRLIIFLSRWISSDGAESYLSSFGRWLKKKGYLPEGQASSAGFWVDSDKNLVNFKQEGDLVLVAWAQGLDQDRFKQVVSRLELE